MIVKNLPVTDTDFNALYPLALQEMAAFHFTPIEVAKVAANWLVTESGTRVLDIGAGAGKFCMIGAAHTDGHFIGIEQRKSLVELSDKLIAQFELEYVVLLHANVVDISFKPFHAFYFFNSFFENLDQSDKLDNSVDLQKEAYIRYSLYVKNQLDQKPLGTRLVTYFSYWEEVPDSYEMIESDFDGKLILWQKIE